jgi:hypothetical protein
VKKLPKKLRKLAKKAGFCFWANEKYGPGPGYVDWANEYDNEIVKFAKLLKKHYHGTKIKS